MKRAEEIGTQLFGTMMIMEKMEKAGFLHWQLQLDELPNERERERNHYSLVVIIITLGSQSTHTHTLKSNVLS